MNRFEGGPSEAELTGSQKKPNPIEQMFSVAESTEIFSGQLARMPEGADKKQLLCNSIRKMGDTYFYGKQVELEQVINTVAQGNYANDEELVAAASQALFSFSREQITPREMEKNIRERFKQEDRENLNDILTYDITGEVANLHLDPAYTLDIKEKLGLMRSGLSEMAIRLGTDEKLKNIKTIRTVSWIVAKNSSILTRMGFTFDGVMSEEEKQKADINDKRPIGVAHISREDFIRGHIKE
jgi:hypothetical protein